MKGMRKFFWICLLAACELSAQKNAELAFSKSYLYEYETQYNKAIQALQELGAESYQLNLRLGWLHYLNKDYMKAETYYRKAISIEPASVEARFGLALPLSALGNWNEILNVYMEILKQDPNNSIANYRTASIFYSRNNYAEATKYILKVIRIYPFDYDSNLLYGKILLAQGKPTEAKKFYEKAIQYNPQSEEARTALKKL
jgi:tetratricopeptide (TPR) repeat protein